ncbi:MAG: P-loop NTPase [bacterium]
MITKDKVIMSLRGLKEPSSQKDFTQLNLVDVEIKQNDIFVKIYLKKNLADQEKDITDKVIRKLKIAFGEDINVSVNYEYVNDYSEVKRRIRLEVLDSMKARLGRVIAVTSGKGGVGKSTISIGLAYFLKELGYRVGLLDADVYGPSIPTAFGLEGHILHIKDEKIQPINKFGLSLVSIGFMIPEIDTPLIWRGPMLHKAINEMVNQVEWNDLDYLVADLPPGTGDAILSLNSSVKIDGAVVVSTAQRVAAADVMKNINMLKTLSIPIIGIVENMSYVECPEGHRVYLWGKNGVKEIAQKYDIEYLGQIPFLPDLVEAMEVGNITNLSEKTKEIFIDFCRTVINRLNLIAVQGG